MMPQGHVVVAATHKFSETIFSLPQGYKVLVSLGAATRSLPQGQRQNAAPPTYLVRPVPACRKANYPLSRQGRPLRCPFNLPGQEPARSRRAGFFITSFARDSGPAFPVRLPGRGISRSTGQVKYENRNSNGSSNAQVRHVQPGGRRAASRHLKIFQQLFSNKDNRTKY